MTPTRSRLAVVCLALAGFSNPANAQVWSELGPAPTNDFGTPTGRVSAIVASPTNTNRYLVAGADGGVWRTTDGGASWTPLTDALPTTAIGALALDPTNENIIYAGSGEANFANHSRYGLGVYKSTDGGSTWSVLAQSQFSGRCFSRIIVHPTTPTTLYAAVTRAGGFPSLAAAKGHPGASGAVGVFRSTDSGVTWTQLAGGLPALDATDLVINPTTPSTLFAAIGYPFGSTSNGIYKSTNSGTTWTKLAGGLPTGSIGRIGLAIAPSNTSRLYTIVTNPAAADGSGASTLGTYRTDNAGTSWSLLSLSNFQSSYGWYFTTITVKPTNADEVYFAALDAYRSTNAGASFSLVSPQHPDIHAAAWDASGRLLLGDDGGVHRTANNGATWTPMNNGLGTVQLYAGLSTHPTDANIMYAGLQDNGTCKRTGPNKLWESLLGGDGGWTQLDQSSPNIVFGESQGTGSLSRSTDGGINWTFAGNGLSGRNCFEPPYLIDPAASTRMIYGTERVWVTNNRGDSWAPLSPDLTAGGNAAIRALAIAPSNSNFVYAATNDSRVLSSTNGGSTFALRLSDAAGWPRVTRELTVHPTNPQIVYLAGATFGTPHVRRSTNGGVSWSILDGDLPNSPVNVIAVDPRGVSPILYAGADGGVYRSIDNGQSWRHYGQSLPNACVVDIRFELSRARLVIATQGRGAWSIPALCPSDFNADGFVNGDDFDAFLAAFELGDAAADFNGDGFVNGDDFDTFVASFEAGC